MFHVLIVRVSSLIILSEILPSILVMTAGFRAYKIIIQTVLNYFA
jgi:hypothetical protein